MLSTLVVPAPVRGLVASFWTYAGHGEPHRVLPDGCLDFIFNLRAGTATIVGPMSRAITVPVPAGLVSFGVRFRPGHAARFIDAHANELLDEQGELAGLTRLKELAGRIAEARDHEERTSLLTSALLDANTRIRASDACVERAVALIAHARGNIPVSRVAALIGLGERQLERRFLERVGQGPKRFARIVRFEHALALAARLGLPQAELAARAGYSDEPHLLRDFRALCDSSPKALLRELKAEHARDVGFVQGGATGARYG